MAYPPRNRDSRGFKPASSLLKGRIRAVAETRGFAMTDLLTRWEAVVGASVAAQCDPVDVHYGRGGIGATLTLQTTGASAPLIEMQKPQIIERINACYGYRAINAIRITQSARKGQWQARSAQRDRPAALPVPEQKARDYANVIENTDLRLALEQMAANVLAKSQSETSKK